MRHRAAQRSQRGAFLIEVLVAITIFAIGILAMISMQAVSIAAQNDSQFRSEAEHLIDQLVGQMRLNVGHDPTTGTLLAADFTALAHRPTTDANCSYSGAASTNAIVTNWVKTVKGQDSGGNAILGKGLPGVTDARLQILANSSVAGINQLRVTICWQGGNDKAAHSHTVVAYLD
jgi:type IV pilus assembly protein PilV